MSQQLISRSPDLKSLRDEGYEIEVRGGHLLAHHVPYVNSTGEIKYGSLVTNLILGNNEKTSRPDTHLIHFIGEHPCNKDGSIITAIQNASQRIQLTAEIIINYSFSNKPSEGYPDYYQKIVQYVKIISGPAQSLDPTVTARTFKVIQSEEDDSPFQYLDTNSSRSNLGHLNEKFKGHRVAILGLGGTGAFVLDFISKTPVEEIHLFDKDLFLQHNAFRSPGAPSSAILEEGMTKVKYYTSVYSQIHRGVIPHPYFMLKNCMHELDLMDFVFICVDQDDVKREIMHNLLTAGVSFVDVGLGVNIVEDQLIGTVRVTTGTPDKHDHLDKRIACGSDENEYSTNIQIVELNSMNASLAVIKWKKMFRFYQDLEQEHHSTYSINVAQLLNEDLAT